MPDLTSSLLQVAASSQVFAAASRSGPESAPCSCHLLSHQNLLWHHRLGHPSLPRLRGMASRVLVSGLPRSLPPLPPGPASTCVPCVEGRQRAAPHSSVFPPTEAPQQTLHMDLWGPARPFAVLYAAHQINLQLRVSLPETSPTLRWTGKVGDASAFRVWGSRAFIRDLSVDKLSSRAVPCVFLGFLPDAPGWQFYHPTSRLVLSSHDVTFDESGPAPTGVSQVDAVEPVKVAADSGASGGAEPERAEPRGAGSGGAELERAGPGNAASGGAEPGAAGSGGVEPFGAGPGGPSGA
ncbi:unnamed protein product, partial [Closterium sp. NIES-54]